MKNSGGNKPTPNDQRGVVKNPNNPAHGADKNNRGNQQNPNHAPTNPPPKTGGGKTDGGKKA